MSGVAYLLDENTDPRLFRASRRRYPTMPMRRMGDQGTPALGTADPDILAWCEATSTSLVTNNRHSMPAHLHTHLAAGRHAPGIFVLPRRSSIAELVERLALVWGASEAEEHVDQLIYLAQIT